MLFRPCLGQPCFVGLDKIDEGFKIVVVSNTGNSETIREKLGDSLKLSKVGQENTEHPLVIEKKPKLLYVYKDGSPHMPKCMTERLDTPGWHLFSTEIYKPPVWFFEVPLTFKQQPVISGQRTIELYNLDRLSPARNVVERKYHAVCLTKRTWETFNFIHVSDLHIAKRNDQIFNLISASKSDKQKNYFRKRYVNFNDHLRCLIRQANRLVNKGELDFILMTGDLIDYINPSLGDADQTNWKIFHDILTGDATTTNRPEVPLQAPIFTVLGNHDFRLHHYKLGGIGGNRWKEYGLNRKEFKQFNRIEPNIGIAEPLEANLFGIADYLLNFNPDLEYVVNLGEHQMLCLDSGEDAFVSADIHMLITSAIKRVVKEGMPSALTYLFMHLREIYKGLRGVLGGGPESAGLYYRQIDWASRALDEAKNRLTFVAMHAPPVNKPPGLHFERYREILRRRAGKTGWIHTDEVDLSAASIFRNWHQFLDFLVGINDDKKGVNLVLCGHTHCNLAFRLKKYSAMEGRPTRFPQKHKVAICTDKYPQYLDKAGNPKRWWQKHQPLILQTPSLGPEGKDKSPPGYRWVQVADNIITKLDYCPLKRRISVKNNKEETMPQITLTDLSLTDYKPTPRVSRLRKAYFRAMPEICVERPRLITRFSLKNGLFNQEGISILDKARMYRYVLENRALVVHHRKGYEKQKGNGNKKGPKSFKFDDDNLFAGSTTSKFKGVPLYPDLTISLLMWPELWTISTRDSNPFQITKSEVEELNYDIFPHWMEENVLEIARKRCFEENLEKLGREKYAPELKLFEQLVFFIPSKAGGISHTIPNLSKAINVGLRGIIDEAKENAAETSEPSKKEFYDAIPEALEGVIAYSHNLAAEAERMAKKEKDARRKQELLDIAEIHRRVPEFPARTFREGLTTLWMCWVTLHVENRNFALSTGRMDQFLYALYRQDIDNGTIDIQDAIELLCCLWLKIGDNVPAAPDTSEQLFGGTGSNQAITIGGVDKDGNDAVNDLTYVILRAIELMKLRDPNPNARYYPRVNSKDYLKQLCRVNINTGAIPAIHNDKAIIKALTSKGDTLEQARDYGVIGCVEPESSGRTYGFPAAILLNLISTLELTLFNGRHRHTGMNLLISKKTGKPTTFTTFEQFKSAFEEQTRWLIEQTTTLNNILGRVYQDFQPTPILSALFEGPMEKGKDLIQGGAILNSSGATIIGLADVADSLSAIQKVVFDEGMPFADFLDALEKNFKGQEALQKRLMNPDSTPKYGNEDPVAEANVSWLVEMLDEAFGEKMNYRGGHYRVGYWTMTNHAGFGRLIKATPNGRKAGENFTSGITPVSGVTPYLTKTLNSVAGLPASCLASGVALNLKFTPEDGDKEKMLDNFVASVEGYFDDDDGKRDGGMEIQFNITNHDTFADAFAHPEKYPELLVRVSGYTAYFKDLNPQMQKEIIDRTEYRLSTGEMIPYEPFSLPERRK